MCYNMIVPKGGDVGSREDTLGIWKRTEEEGGKSVEKSELWHVLVDDATGQRSCFYGYYGELTFNLEGEFEIAGHGKTEVPMEEWTAEELCWMMAGILKSSKMSRLAGLPRTVLEGMEACGVEEEKRLEVMRQMLVEIRKVEKGGCR